MSTQPIQSTLSSLPNLLPLLFPSSTYPVTQPWSNPLTSGPQSRDESPGSVYSALVIGLVTIQYFLLVLLIHLLIPFVTSLQYCDNVLPTGLPFSSLVFPVESSRYQRSHIRETNVEPYHFPLQKPGMAPHSFCQGI